MRENRSGYIKNFLLPCVTLSALAGVFTAVAVFLFKLAASWVISISGMLYSCVRSRPWLLPVALLTAILSGILVWLIVRNDSDSRGGGIPTAVAALRGFTSLNWIKSALIVPLSAMITFLAAVPLGNEGPCVQMGTAIGQGTVSLFGGRKNQAWRRYIMTGGACAGFSAATGAPITGILFAVEEAHRRISPMLFMVASISVVVAQITMEALGALTGVNVSMFHFRIDGDFPLKYLWIPVIVGAVCGIVAIFFTKGYRLVRKMLKVKLKKVPLVIKMAGVFAITAAVGFFSSDSIGSGHDLIDRLISGEGIWYLLILCFAVRAFMLILANNIGVTGGLFIPTLAFGAIIGALCAKVLTFTSLAIDQYEIVVIIGMASFLAASSRTPITAVVFAAEVLCGFAYILPVAVGVAVSYIVIETVGVESFTDTVIESKIDSSRKDRKPIIFDVYLTVQPCAFVVEKEIRDILWPPTCVVLGVEKNTHANTKVGISEGDILHVHYQSFAPHATFEELERLVGRQSEDVRLKIHTHGENHQVPEI